MMNETLCCGKNDLIYLYLNLDVKCLYCIKIKLVFRCHIEENNTHLKIILFNYLYHNSHISFFHLDLI